MPRPRYTKADYETFADLLNQSLHSSTAWYNMELALCELFRNDNPKFDVDTFVARARRGY